MRRFVIPLALVAGLGVVLWGCSDDDGGTGPTPDANVVGTWVGEFTAMTPPAPITVVFTAANAYTVDATYMTAPAYHEDGAYSVTGVTVTFVPDTCYLPGISPFQPCSTKTVTVNGDTITYPYMTETVSLVKQP
jgi:hypothetical protein